MAEFNYRECAYLQGPPCRCGHSRPDHIGSAELPAEPIMLDRWGKPMRQLEYFDGVCTIPGCECTGAGYLPEGDLGYADVMPPTFFDYPDNGPFVDGQFMVYAYVMPTSRHPRLHRALDALYDIALRFNPTLTPDRFANRVILLLWALIVFVVTATAVRLL